MTRVSAKLGTVKQILNANRPRPGPVSAFDAEPVRRSSTSDAHGRSTRRGFASNRRGRPTQMTGLGNWIRRRGEGLAAVPGRHRISPVYTADAFSSSASVIACPTESPSPFGPLPS